MNAEATVADRMRGALRRHRDPLLLVILAAALVLPNLGSVPLWQDEAETALLARNITTYGYPLASDARSVITQNRELEFGEDRVWTWSPWAQLYVAAASFIALGESATSARLPFALVGALSVGFLYVHVLALTGRRRVAFLAAGLMITSLPFLLHARQCRWYMLAVFFTIWLLHAYLRMGRQERGAAYHFVAASALLFHSNFLVAAYVIPGIVLHHGVAWVAGFRRPPARTLLFSLMGFAALILPWALYAEIWSRPNALESIPGPFLQRALRILSMNLSSLNHELLPLPAALALPWAWASIRERRVRAELIAPILVVVCGLLLLTLLPWMYFRYLIGLLPVCCLLYALVLDRLLTAYRPLGVTICIVALASNAFSLALSPRELRFDLARHVLEVMREPDGPNQGIIEFLALAGDRDDLVLTNYGQLPILFHTGMRAVGFGQDLKIVEDPDWIIVRHGRPGRGYLEKRALGYEKIRLSAPDLRWGNRPDPEWQRLRARLQVPRIAVRRRPAEGS